MRSKRFVTILHANEQNWIEFNLSLSEHWVTLVELP